MNPITVRAYAKINLTLDILGLRPDGYHEIRSIMQTIVMHDTLAITPTPNAQGIDLTVNGDEATGVPIDTSNIVCQTVNHLQALAAARNILPISKSGLQITLTKHIPSQAGLGGGSSDCAATLLAVDRLFGLNFAPLELRKIAASLGSDVPFFLAGGTTRVEGRGERVTPLPTYRPGAWVVIVKPPVGVSTPSAYAALDAQSERNFGCATATWEGTGRRLANDFHDVVIEQNPIVKAACDAMKFGDGEPPLLCGSGAALFRLMPSEDAALRLSEHIRKTAVGRVWATQLMEGQE